MGSRKIIHIDMDAFFASIEQRDNPLLRGKPIAVGSAQPRGVVSAASYEARAFGVRSAMPSSVALRKCPHIIFVPPRFDVYKSVSEEILEVFFEYTSMVEPLSIDEAFLDVTHNRFNISSATEIAKEIKAKIWNKTKLHASAGVSYNKFLAKVASDQDKPNGLFVITPKQGEKFVEYLPIEKFFGVGKSTAAILHRVGVKTGKQLKQFTCEQLAALLGKGGVQLYHYARGVDFRDVIPNRTRKSIGVEETFEQDIVPSFQLEEHLHLLIVELYSRVKSKNFIGHTLVLKIKYNDFTLLSRSFTAKQPLSTLEDITQAALRVFRENPPVKPVRLLGISIKKSSASYTEAFQLKIDFEYSKNHTLSLE